jgi:hypothetical protein
VTRTFNSWSEASKRAHLDKLHSRRRPDDAARFRKYGLSVLGYRQLLAQQNGVCAICREPDRELVVDHDHKTKRVRALLCGHCNSAIGFLRESPLLARAAAIYLEQQLAKELTGE